MSMKMNKRQNLNKMKATPSINLGRIIMKISPKIKLLSACTLMVLMSACQTTQSIAPTSQAPFVSKHEQSAKHALKTAITKTTKTSFSYHSTIILDNELRWSALRQATPEQLANADSEILRCDEEHDNRYVALGKKALAQGLDISSDSFVQERQALKEQFLACQETYGHDDSWEFGLDESNAAELSGDVLETQDGLKNEVVSTYDTAHTAKDVKKTQLLQAYLLEPMQLSVVGNYRPLVGTFSALPMMDYQFYNAKVMINQPIYVDMNAGEIYLWADNFALANATYLDKKLGLDWQNKWLKLPINDGSLPPSFKEDFIKTYLDALKDSYENTDEKNISYEKPSAQLLAKLNKKQQQLVNQTAVIIAKNSSNDDSQKQQVLRYFYDTMLNKYPVLSEKPSNKTMDSLRFMQSLFAYLDKKANGTPIDLPADTQKNHAMFFGLNAKGEISWVLTSCFVKNFSPDSEPMTIHSFTVLDGKLIPEFERLPQAAVKPSIKNSVELFAYTNQLKDSLVQSENLYIRLLVDSIFGGSEADESLDIDEDMDTDDVERGNE